MNIHHTLLIKVGTNTLTYRTAQGDLELDRDSFKLIATQITELQKEGYAVILISSGAIAAGMVVTKQNVRPRQIALLQTLASIGWRHILNTWAEVFDQKIAELLITRHELNRATESAELLRLLNTLLSRGVVPIINENDAITHEEITYGDNDILTAHLGNVIKQSSLFKGDISIVLLSDVDGLYKNKNDASTRISKVDTIEKYRRFIDVTKSDGGSGGMASKLTAPEIATSSGVDLFITNGRRAHSIKAALYGKEGTHFIKQVSNIDINQY